MSSLVLELQCAAAESGTSVAELLRKSIVVASKLAAADFGTWAESELSGYPAAAAVPEYRRLRGELRAHNPYHGWIPVIVSDSALSDTLEVCSIRQAIGELEGLHRDAGSTGTLRMPLPTEIVLKLVDSRDLEAGILPALLFGRAAIAGILDAVRNEVLRWSLELEKRGVLGQGMTFSSDEKARALGVTYHIGSFAGVLGDVHASQVQIGDYTAIHNRLREAGIPQDARNEIENILSDLRTATPEKRAGVIERGMNWLTKYGPAIGALSETVRGWLQTLHAV